VTARTEPGTRSLGPAGRYAKYRLADGCQRQRRIGPERRPTGFSHDVRQGISGFRISCHARPAHEGKVCRTGRRPFAAGAGHNRPVDPIGAADLLLGRAVERSMAAHHRHRLRRLGRLDALEPCDDDSPWCREPPPPRDGCSIDVLIDGAEMLRAIAQAIRSARRSVRIAGWHSAPHFALEREEPPAVLRELLAQTVARGVEVRVLLWAGAPFHVFTPSRADVRADARELARDTGVRVAVDDRERLLHCHHEKLVVVDEEVAFVGGVDLTNLGGDRWDTARHPARGRLGWHDAGSRLRGPIVADVAEHLDLRWTAVTREQLRPVPVAAQAGDKTIQLLRTIPEHVYDRKRGGAFGILEGYMRALRSARELVYLESQFFWLLEIVDLLSAKLRDPPSDRFRVVVLLPSKPNNGEEDTRGMLAHLADADSGRGRFLATTIDAMTGSTVDQLYVHAKIGIVDDRWLTIGSANINAHSFFNDTEVNVQIYDQALARATRMRLWSEHLGLAEDEIAGDPTDVVDRLWVPIARSEGDRRRTGQRREHRLRELSPSSRKLERLLGPMDAIVVDG
jgi:phosphatidylserine/phosphatidylglycerophosphate/cardiolipin synthase-like enzyme